ncbi:Lrp/AsnC family transcriptional regulator [Rhizobium populisoli]|uniref:Lrp/AsnC family transcriptional regulator n=1 Tax=Rhizobium populisoli TaxID=2859785 RepID=UPI002484D181|nr:AsnC family transcriptional regulator [Rhizobium populisoli]
MSLDAIDLKILRVLQADARAPNIGLAEKVGLSPSPCSCRVTLFEQAGMLESCQAIISRAAVGCPSPFLQVPRGAGVGLPCRPHRRCGPGCGPKSV